MNRSLRFRLLAGTSLATSLIFSALGAVIYFKARQSILLDFDAALLTEALTLAASGEQEGPIIKFELNHENFFNSKGRPTLNISSSGGEMANRHSDLNQFCHRIFP